MTPRETYPLGVNIPKAIIFYHIVYKMCQILYTNGRTVLVTDLVEITIFKKDYLF